MKGELVWTSTADRMRLHGFYVESHNQGALEYDFDAAVILHGLAGNYYSSGLLSFLGRQFSSLGISVVLGNTRGHDLLNLSTQSGRSVLNGAAIENVADGTFDVNGWVKYLQGCGHSRILVVGHSLGAIKGLYSLANDPLPAIAGLIAISATRLSFEQFANCSSREQFLSSYNEASALVAAGRETELIQFEFPFPTWMGAKSFLDKYGPRSQFDWTKFVDLIDKPVLMTFGQRELEEHPAFEGLERIAQRVADQQSNMTLAQIPNADHFYVACFDALWNSIESWLPSQK